MARQVVDEEAELDLPSDANMVVTMLCRQALELHARLRALDLRLAALQRSDDVARRFSIIPGIGPVGATALAASVGDPHQFRSGLLERKPARVAGVAMANKMARIAWAIMTCSQVYQAHHAPILAA